MKKSDKNKNLGLDTNITPNDKSSKDKKNDTAKVVEGALDVLEFVIDIIDALN